MLIVFFKYSMNQLSGVGCQGKNSVLHTPITHPAAKGDTPLDRGELNLRISKGK